MSYTHLTERERYVINHLRLAGRGVTQIAQELGRAKGTISRELRRNAGPLPSPSGGGGKEYWDRHAHAAAKARRVAGRESYKLGPGPLLEEVRAGLSARHSPDEIAGRLALDHPDDPAMRISHESIYLWVYRQEDPRWHLLLRKKGARRRPRGRKKASDQGQIIGRVGIEHRPAEVAERTRLGDWESDTLCGEPGTGAVAVHVERVTRAVVAAKLSNRTADAFATRTLAAFRAAGVPACGLLTLTADNGKEFAQFPRLEAGLGLKVYFANPHAPWERGTNENTNGLIRDYFPKGTDFTGVTKADVDNMVRSMNNRPRKCLGYQTPREVFEKLAGVALQT